MIYAFIYPIICLFIFISALIFCYRGKEIFSIIIEFIRFLKERTVQREERHKVLKKLSRIQQIKIKEHYSRIPFDED